MTNRITLLIIGVMLASFCDGQNLVGNWRRINPSQSSPISDTILHSGDLIIKQDSTFIMVGDISSIVGTWINLSKSKLELWCEPKIEMIKIHLSIVTVTQNELVVKLFGTKTKFSRF